MIETLEEYERAKYVSRVVMGPTTRKAMSTVDAMLPLVRAARYWNSDGPTDELQDALDALPEWMKQEKR